MSQLLHLIRILDNGSSAGVALLLVDLEDLDLSCRYGVVDHLGVMDSTGNLRLQNAAAGQSANMLVEEVIFLVRVPRLPVDYKPEFAIVVSVILDLLYQTASSGSTPRSSVVFFQFLHLDQLFQLPLGSRLALP